MTQNSEAREHYLNLIEKHGARNERMHPRAPIGFTFRPFQQPYGMPSTWFEAPETDARERKKK